MKPGGGEETVSENSSAVWNTEKFLFTKVDLEFWFWGFLRKSITTSTRSSCGKEKLKLFFGGGEKIDNEIAQLALVPEVVKLRTLAMSLIC